MLTPRRSAVCNIRTNVEHLECRGILGPTDEVIFSEEVQNLKLVRSGRGSLLDLLVPFLLALLRSTSYNATVGSDAHSSANTGNAVSRHTDGNFNRVNRE